MITSIERSVTTNEVKASGLYYHKERYVIVDIHDGQLKAIEPESPTVNLEEASGLSGDYDTTAVIVY